MRAGGRIGIGLGAALAAAAAAAGTPRLECEARAVLAQGTFASAEAAFAAAAAAYRELSAREDREYMGGVFATARGEFRFSAGAGLPARDEVTVRIAIPPGLRLVALWHTHGAPHFSREYFSDVDTALAERLGLPFFLATPSGALRVFTPGDGKLSPREAAARGLGRGTAYARGQRIALAPV